MEVLLFGSIAEKANAQTIVIEAKSVMELRMQLIARVPDLRGMSYAIAVDRRVVLDDLQLAGNEEVAVLPPFAGG